MSDSFTHSLPFGATLNGETTKFRIWAPSVSAVSVEIEGELHPLASEPDGWHSTAVSAPAGTPYSYKLPDGLSVPDPGARAQKKDVHGPSVVVDPSGYRWKHGEWLGRPWNEAVIYELHPGVFGGFKGIAEHLPRLAKLGVTVIELMPIADFPGRHNWGYDGVLPYAPDTAYGTPDELKALVDAAHGLGLMIMLDVVYNHFGPDGAYLHAYAKTFFREDIHTPWGAAIDFDRAQVREFFEQNALYWLMEYRFDGLRFDAVHAINDPSFLNEMTATVRSSVEPGRHVHLVMEHEGNASSHLKDGPDAAGFDAQWADDFHHAMHVLITGETEGYYEDFADPIHKLARCMAEGFAYQGDISKHSGKPRGEPSGYLPTTAFVICLQNHDQIGNRAMGDRLATMAPRKNLEAATTLLLLSPFIPLLFMGEEVFAETPFLFFTDHNHDLAELVRNGRREEFKHFAAFQDPERREKIPDPNAPETFAASGPSFDGALDFHQNLLALRKKHIMPGILGCRTAGVDVLSDSALVAKWTLGTGGTLWIAGNFGKEPVAFNAPSEDALFATPSDASTTVRSGTLPGYSTVVWIIP